jgi:hypothetical protein
MEMIERLRTARPQSITRVHRVGERTFDVESCIRKDEPAHVVLDEGYDPHHSPLNRPVYWRIVERADGKFYLSTFLADRGLVTKGWGSDAASIYCDPVTGMAFARMETSLKDAEQ